MDDCVFCKIVNGEISAEKIFEDNDFIAFLSITPVYDGLTVVATKRHLDSDVYKSMSDEELSKMHVFAKKVALILSDALEPERVMQVLEGLEVNHAHIKLFPKYKGVFNATVESEKPVDFEKLKIVADRIRSKT